MAVLEIDFQIEKALLVVIKVKWFWNFKEHVRSGSKPPSYGARVLEALKIVIRVLIDFVLMWCRNRSLCKRHCIDGRRCT